MRLLATAVFLSMIALAAAAAVSPARSGVFAPTRVDAGGGTTTAVAGWQIQSSDKAQEDGAEISSAGFSTRGWYPVSGRATVMA
ncbi:MAG TPA: hypothetical protein VF415_04335, partial [Rhodanobacter sp.]